jgi:hypothetical protein
MTGRRVAGVGFDELEVFCLASLKNAQASGSAIGHQGAAEVEATAVRDAGRVGRLAGEDDLLDSLRLGDN